MNTYTIEKHEIKIAGVSTRTTNAEEMGSNGRLPQLWETYFSGGTAAQPYNQNSHLIYGLYTDYESDATGAYTVILGHEVNVDPASDGVAYAVVPASKYRVFTTRKGPVYEVVAEAWGFIWQYYMDSSEERAYTGDFELYDGSNFDPTNSEIQIYIAIK
ncbi:GyrI-like domain-containing protein [Paenibacillus sp. L3-i20]|uniref:GyrI-like domain-containing protein n=1 Tax=Paenibacillus sp. L3-i20 TaxID=2905833 RepID=UPI001EE08CE8|nr:GyrI-like domain-containing protein [Paenibacillus sp. L3-i20]GKU77423.1 DNA-binding protein [Paenibacillus sp. L3-i20]